MSVDTVNYALTTVRQRIAFDQSNAFSTDGKAKLIYMMGCMRDHLMRGSIQDFDDYVDNALSAEPDAMDYILDELFSELGFPEGIREQLSAKLAE